MKKLLPSILGFLVLAVALVGAGSALRSQLDFGRPPSAAPQEPPLAETNRLVTQIEQLHGVLDRYQLILAPLMNHTNRNEEESE